MKDRIYVCHTPYHVYVTLLKEFVLPKEQQNTATLVLSKMSSDFSSIYERIQKLGIFEKVLEYDEKRFTFFDSLNIYKHDNVGFIRKIWNRILFTKRYGKLQEKYVPVNFKEYKDIYVYCDSDPIGIYLNYKRIPYHALEDGLNTIIHTDAARYDNRCYFWLKAFLAKNNLIFIQNGYSKYCIDMEVNQIEGIRYPNKKYKEVPRKDLEARLTETEKSIIIKTFVSEPERLKTQLTAAKKEKKSILILTEPLCDLETRKQIFSDLIKEYKKQGSIIIKPHPRDELTYEDIFPDYMILDKKIPMEVLNLLGESAFDLAVGVFTDIKGIRFAKESLRLGPDFMDKYETPEIHRQNEQI